MAFTATITMNSGEVISATAISYSADTGRLTFSGASNLLTRSPAGLVASSASAGFCVLDEVATVTVA